MTPFEAFMSVDMRVGTVVEVLPFPEARKPAYKVRVDLGPELGSKWSSAQLLVHYQPEDLVGRQVLCVVNLGPRQIGPFFSEVLIAGADAEGGVVVFTTERPVPNGSRLY
jgi:tRNA-binding protein